jgi:DNA-directed RNA polymerase
VDKRGQKQAIAPNVVHSLDAAHLQRVLNHPEISIYRQQEWPSTIHDSYSVHPNHISFLGRILRETFAEMYSEDVLGKLEAEWSRVYRIPSPPAKGTLDISEVLKSEFIFS